MNSFVLRSGEHYVKARNVPRLVDVENATVFRSFGIKGEDGRVERVEAIDIATRYARSIAIATTAEAI